MSDELSLPDAVARAQANLSKRESNRLIKVRTTVVYKLRAKCKIIPGKAATITLVFYNILILH